jgi:uncharacterized membrane protein SpoIIM required for sporulation
VNEQSFVNHREPEWHHLQWLCDRAESAPKSLTGSDLQEFLRVYRNVSGDLANVRTQTANEPLIFFLNQLVGRAYGILYQSRREKFLKAIWNGIIEAADTVRRRKWFVFAAALTFFGTWISTFVIFTVRPDVRSTYLETMEMKEVIEQWKQGNHHSDEPSDADSQSSMMMAGFYAGHNPVVAIETAAVGAGTFGLGTLHFLSENGMIIGILCEQMNEVGKLPHLLIWIWPHGVPELSSIVVAGAGGYALGWALICPGRKRRGQALKEAGRDAIVLIVAAVTLDFIAAPIEGFFSFKSYIPDAVKVMVIAVEIAAWTAFWVGFGKKAPESLIRS